MGLAGNPLAKKRRALPIWLMSLLIILLTAAVYWPVIGHDFLDWDDNLTILTNPDFDPNNPHADFAHYWAKPYLELYMPLTYMAWGATAQFSQMRNPAGAGYVLDPAGFHLLSVCLHCIDAMLVFLVLRRLVSRDWAAWLGAAMFALHPLQVESVAWITSTSILLSSAFSLWAMWHYLRFDELRYGEQKIADRKAAAILSPSALSWIHFNLGTVAFALALLSKPSIVIVPLLLIAIVIGLRCRGILQAWPLAIWLVLCVPIMIVTRLAQTAWMIHVPSIRRPIVALDALGFYIWKMGWPLWLIPDYSRTPAAVLSHPNIWMILVPLALVVVCALFWKRSRWPAILVAVFIIALLPVLGLTPFSYQRYSTVADRYMYLAMLAPALAVAVLLCVRLDRLTASITAIILAALGVMTFVQLGHWRNTQTLFTYTLAKNPNSLAANFVLGEWYAKQGDLPRAISFDEAALIEHPHDGRVLYQFGNALLNSGKDKEAIDAYQKALASPATSNFEAGTVSVNDALPPGDSARVYNNLGAAYIRLRDVDRAIENFKKAAELDPQFEPNYRKAMALRAQQQR